MGHSLTFEHMMDAEDTVSNQIHLQPLDYGLATGISSNILSGQGGWRDGSVNDEQRTLDSPEKQL